MSALLNTGAAGHLLSREEERWLGEVMAGGRKIAETGARLGEMLQRPPSQEEVAAALGVSPLELEAAETMASQVSAVVLLCCAGNRLALLRAHCLNASRLQAALPARDAKPYLFSLYFTLLYILLAAAMQSAPSFRGTTLFLARKRASNCGRSKNSAALFKRSKLTAATLPCIRRLAAAWCGTTPAWCANGRVSMPAAASFRSPT